MSKKQRRIESLNILKQHLGYTAVIVVEGYTYAVRFAPDTVITLECIRNSWYHNPRAWRPFDTGTNTFTR